MRGNRLPFADVPLIDHHCHSLLRRQPETPRAFRACFTESDAPEIVTRHLEWSLFYRRSLRDLAAYFGCAPSLDAVLAARRKRPLPELARAMFTDAAIGGLFVDMGFRAAESYDLAGLRGLLPCPAAPVLRLEVLAEELIPAAPSWTDLRDRFAAGVRRALADGVRSLKTIIAYRTGLRIEAWDAAALTAAFRETRAAFEGGRRRLASKPLLDALVWTALEIAAERRTPVQIHAGFGDRDLDLRLANPLWLRPALEHPAFRDIPIVLLHSYPYVREAAWLAHVYPHVYLDLSLTVPFAAHAAADAVVEALGLAPASKVLLATDAFSIPELFWLGARAAREALGAALRVIEGRGYLAAGEAPEVARLLLHDNAVAVYGGPP